jgi:heptosyltransferase-2
VSARLSGRERIAVRAPSWLGDFVAAEPALRALHGAAERAGNGRGLALIAPEPCLRLLEGRFPGMQRVPLGSSGAESIAPWRERDVALLLDGSLRSAALAARARVPVRAGYASGGRSLLLTHGYVPARERGGVPVGLGRAGRLPRRLPRPFASACAELLAWLGIPVVDRAPRLSVSARAREEVEDRLVRAGLDRGVPFVLANAGSRPGSAKGFPPERFAAALDVLARLAGLPVAIACAPGEEGAARETAARCAMAKVRLLDDPPPDPVELAALSAAARLAIGPDNGARHVAEAVGTPCVVLCGPTDPRHSAEHGSATAVLRVEVDCGPCHRETCPLFGDRRHACMLRLDPDRVAEAAAELLR